MRALWQYRCLSPASCSVFSSTERTEHSSRDQCKSSKVKAVQDDYTVRWLCLRFAYFQPSPLERYKCAARAPAGKTSAQDLTRTLPTFPIRRIGIINFKHSKTRPSPRSLQHTIDPCCPHYTWKLVEEEIRGQQLPTRHRLRLYSSLRHERTTKKLGRLVSLSRPNCSL